MLSAVKSSNMYVPCELVTKLLRTPVQHYRDMVCCVIFAVPSHNMWPFLWVRKRATGVSHLMGGEDAKQIINGQVWCVRLAHALNPCANI